ncbi:hypothetical protein RHMOL_Rhmol05G0135500 [Rhododendron molle]|uniref:Uncharacterized protein n=1 Tax=Rhododendron molle TaxID=49168 RepID=A0ACC0NPX3_RHOML|nr:hypothetical protein RHMOL_Rhmol05G0135500 [Rhododendron molle]
MKWYNQLKPQSITSFDELELEFTKWFVTSSIQPKTLSMLVNMCRKPEETLRMYIEQYWEVYNLIPDYNQVVAAESFMNGLDPSCLMFRDLSRNPSKSMSGLMTIIEKDCMHEEAVAEHAKPKVPDSPKFSTGPSVIKKQLLSTIGQLPFFRWPTEMMGTTNARTGHCSFHNEHGHYMTRCGPFKRYLEELAAAGHLNQWIDTRHTPLPPPPLERARLVGVIHGIVSETKATELQTEMDKAIVVQCIDAVDIPVVKDVGVPAEERSAEELIKMAINGDGSQYFPVGNSLDPSECDKMFQFLLKYIEDEANLLLLAEERKQVAESEDTDCTAEPRVNATYAQFTMGVAVGSAGWSSATASATTPALVSTSGVSSYSSAASSNSSSGGTSIVAILASSAAIPASSRALQ